ncbi:unnamed protein product [Citrullus colocynthis]|uniref:Uncharacterized protein n=1 Tax=Citrullus colocynthis TaxID=252529 RepID=A0ABP0YEI8_9ROSI
MAVGVIQPSVPPFISISSSIAASSLVDGSWYENGNVSGWILLCPSYRRFDFIALLVDSPVKEKHAEKGIGLTPFEIGKKGVVSVIDFKVLEKASGNFEERNELGEGRFGRGL